MIEQISEKWSLLEQSASSAGDQLVQRRVFLEAQVQLYMVMEQGTRRRLFRYCVDEAAAQNFRTAVTSPGMEIRSLRLPEQYGEGSTVIQLTLTDIRYEDLFDVLLQDICERAVQSANAVSAGNVIASRIRDWLEFFTLNDPAGLSEERQRGLYGELSFVRKICDANLANVVELACWVGPSGADQDFQFRQTAVEVKVTLSAQNQELLVSSERQLNSEGFRHLFLNHLSLSSRRNSGETLPALIRDVRAKIPEGWRLTLEQLIFQAGYLEVHATRYDEHGFIVREENFFEVRLGFPRITETQLSPGVGKVKYAISVPFCRQFLVGEDVVMEAIRAEYDSTN